MASNYDSLIELIKQQLQQSVPNVSAGNSNQVQFGSQTGDYASTGTTNQQQTGLTSGVTSSTSTPIDTLGLTGLVAGSAPQIASSDQATRNWLQDFMQTGGTGFNSQVNQAVRAGVSGPSVVNADESAQARAAGYAGANVARNNAGQRLQAAQQLEGASGLGTLTQQASPLLGKQDTGASTQLNLQNLVGNETQSGTASGTSTAAGTGTVPEGQPVKTGGCFVCTAYADAGEMAPGAIRRGAEYKLSNLDRYGLSLRGYALYGPTLARLVMSNRVVKWAMRGLTRLVLYEEVRRSRPARLRSRVDATIAHALFHYGSVPFGIVSRLIGHDGYVHDPVVKDALVRNNLAFNYNLRNY